MCAGALVVVALALIGIVIFGLGGKKKKMGSFTPTGNLPTIEGVDFRASAEEVKSSKFDKSTMFKLVGYDNWIKVPDKYIKIPDHNKAALVAGDNSIVWRIPIDLAGRLHIKAAEDMKITELDYMERELENARAMNGQLEADLKDARMSSDERFHSRMDDVHLIGDEAERLTPNMGKDKRGVGDGH
jgi:hypothetical protein